MQVRGLVSQVLRAGAYNVWSDVFHRLRHFRASLMLLIAVTHWMAATGAAYGANFYVNGSTGSDSGSGSSSDPLLTVTEAADRCINTGGADTIYVRGGIAYGYTLVDNCDGVTIMPWDEATYGRPVFTDPNTPCCDPADGVFQILDSKNIVVDSIHIDGSPQAGISVLSTDQLKVVNIKIRYCEIQDTQASGIFVGTRGVTGETPGKGPTVILIEDNKIHDVCISGSNEAISLVRTTFFTVRDNEIYDDYDSGIDAKVGCSIGDIYGNYIHDEAGSRTRAGIYLDARGWESDINIYDNVIERRSMGIKIGTEVGRIGGSICLEDIYIYNNLINLPTLWQGKTVSNGIQIWDSATSGGRQKKNIKIYNNTILTFVDTSGSNSIPNFLLKDDPGNVISLYLKNNIFAHTNQDEWPKRFIRLWTTSFQDWSSPDWPVIDYNLYTGDPVGPSGPNAVTEVEAGFVDRVGGDFSLTSSSAALGYGDSANGTKPSAGITNSFIGETGVSRGSSFDLGAFERL